MATKHKRRSPGPGGSRGVFWGLRNLRKGEMVGQGKMKGIRICDYLGLTRISHAGSEGMAQCRAAAKNTSIFTPDPFPGPISRRGIFWSCPSNRNPSTKDVIMRTPFRWVTDRIPRAEKIRNQKMKRQARVDGLRAVRGSHGSPKKEKSGPQTFCRLTTRPDGRSLHVNTTKLGTDPFRPRFRCWRSRRIQ